MIKIRKVSQFLKEKTKDPYFKELWELEEAKLIMVKPIIEYRIKNDLSQTQLATAIGVSQQHISNIENGIFSSMATLEKVLLFIGYKAEMKAVSLSAAERRSIKKYINA